MSGFRRLKNLFFRSNVNREIEMEISAHIEMRTLDNIATGMSRAQAQRDALLRFGNAASTRERVAAMDATLVLESVFSDFFFACRQLVRNIGFALITIAVLALGICSSVSIFAFVDATLIKPLPYRDPLRLVGLFESNPLGPRFHLSYLDYLDWKRMNHSFSDVEAFDNTVVALKTANGVQRADAATVGAGFFQLLGVAPLLGRDFRVGEDTLGAPHVVILSYAAWQKRFGERRDILGTTISLDGATTTIVGVLPRDFYFSLVGAADFWMPIQASLSPDLRGAHGILALGRLKDRVAIETASIEINQIASQLSKQYPDADGGRGGTVVPLLEIVVGGIRPTLWLLLSAALLLLLIASVNASGLLLLRFQARQQEIAVRGALGASPFRLIRQFTVEAIVLTITANMTGLLAAFGVVHLLRRLVPLNFLTAMPYLNALGLNGHVMLFAGIVALVTAVLFTLLGTLCAPLTKSRPGLMEGSRGTKTVWRRLGANLVVVELFAATILLVGAGLLTRSFYQLTHAETGLQPDHLATVRLWAPLSKYRKDPQVIELAHLVVDEVGHLPGVQSVAVTHQLPIDNVARGSTTFEIVGDPRKQQDNEVNGREVSAAYFSTIRARLLRGRWFDGLDDASRPHVAVVNRTFARKYFPTQDALRKQIRFDPSLPVVEIVGIVNDLREGSLDSDVQPAVYTPFDQSPDASFYVVARTEQDPESVLPSLVETIHALDADILVASAETMEDRIRNLQSTYLHRSSAWLSSGFAIVALLLSVIGLYGVIAYSVRQRTREIGIRMALGASRDSLYRLVLMEASRLIALGIGAGLFGSIGIAMLMRRLLFQTQPWDGLTLGFVASLLIISAVLACLVPAHRAAAVEPMKALRSE